MVLWFIWEAEQSNAISREAQGTTGWDLSNIKSFQTPSDSATPRYEHSLSYMKRKVTLPSRIYCCL